MICRDGTYEAERKIFTTVKTVRAAKAKSTYNVKFANNEDIIHKSTDQGMYKPAIIKVLGLPELKLDNLL